MKPSQFHSNKQTHNWIGYFIMDKFLTQYIPLYKGNLYDLGCGNMPYKEFFLQYATNYIGVDWNNSLHNISEDTVVSNLNEKIDLPNECADTVISLSVLEHLSSPQTFLNETYRILKKDCYIIMQVPFQYQIHEHPFDYYRFTKYGLQHMLENAGYKEIHIKETGGFWLTSALKFNNHSLKYLRKYKNYSLLKNLIKLFLLPIWSLNQITALMLDKIDMNTDEATGYYVIAKK